jgi:hypothetical protein
MPSELEISDAENIDLIHRMKRTIDKLSEWIKNIEPFAEVELNSKQDEQTASQQLTQASVRVKEHIHSVEILIEYCTIKKPSYRKFELFKCAVDRGEMLTSALERSYNNLKFITRIMEIFDDKNNIETQNV